MTAEQQGRRLTGHGDDDAIRNHAAFISSVADLLHGDYKQSEYGRVILPLVVMISRIVVPSVSTAPGPSAAFNATTAPTA